MVRWTQSSFQAFLAKEAIEGNRNFLLLDPFGEIYFQLILVFWSFKRSNSELGGLNIEIFGTVDT